MRLPPQTLSALGVDEGYRGVALKPRTRALNVGKGDQLGTRQKASELRSSIRSQIDRSTFQLSRQLHIRQQTI